MNIKFLYSILVLIVLTYCSQKKDVPIDPQLLSGKYADSIHGRDSIFIYQDKSYEHIFHRMDGLVESQSGKWSYKPNDVFFERFVFYNDGGPGEDGYFSGTWSTRVFVTEEGQIKLRLSERVYYVKEEEK